MYTLSMTLEVFIAVSSKISLCDVVPCGLVDRYKAPSKPVAPISHLNLVLKESRSVSFVIFIDCHSFSTFLTHLRSFVPSYAPFFLSLLHTSVAPT